MSVWLVLKTVSVYSITLCLRNFQDDLLIIHIQPIIWMSSTKLRY